MGIIEAISSAFKHYAVFRGRARRSEYWYFLLFNSLVSTGLSMIGISEILGVYVLAVMLPGMAVAVRRMHDTNHSGWFLLVPLYNLILMFTEGTAGENRFGSDPKAAPSTRAAVSDARAVPDEIKHSAPAVSTAAKSVSTAAGKTCPSCGAVNAATASFCTSCGAALAGTVRSSFSHAAADAKPTAEKKPADDLWQTPTDF